MINQGENTVDNIAAEEPTNVVAISLPPSLFDQDQLTNEDIGLAFTFYESPNLFPLANGTRDSVVIGSSVIGALIAGKEVLNLDDPVVINLTLLDEVGNIQLVDIVVTCSIQLFRLSAILYVSAGTSVVQVLYI